MSSLFGQKSGPSQSQQLLQTLAVQQAAAQSQASAAQQASQQQQMAAQQQAQQNQMQTQVAAQNQALTTTIQNSVDQQNQAAEAAAIDAKNAQGRQLALLSKQQAVNDNSTAALSRPYLGRTQLVFNRRRATLGA